MSIKKYFFAPLASGLGATRRAAVLLLVMMLTTATAWADDPSWLRQGDSWDATTKTLTVNTIMVAQNAYRNNSVIEHVIVGNGVTIIDGYAFYGCTNLKTVFLGSGVSGLYQYTFNGCTSLKSVVITNSSTVLQFASDALPNHDGLKIYVPKVNGQILVGYMYNPWKSFYDSGKIVGYDWTSGTCALALNNDEMTVGGFAMADTDPGSRGWKNSIGNITSVVIEDGVTHIGDNAFYRCSNMESITIPASVTSIGDYAFYRCDNLATITVDANNQAFDSRDNCNAIIRKADNMLILGCKTTVIPNSVTSIGASAFYGCSGLTTVSIPDGVTSIGYSAFSGCANLESVHIGSGVSSIGESAFNDCDKLATITVDVGNQTFDSREGSNAIIRKADNTLVAGSKTTIIPNSVTSIGPMAFWGNDGLTSITIPNSVTSIGISAFYWCKGLTSITIPNSVTSIRDGAFASCSNLASVTLNGVATIGENAFDTGTTVTIAEGLILYNGTELLSGAITDRSKLNGKTLQRCYSITLPDHVTASGTAGVLNNIIYALPAATVTISAATGYAISDIAVNGSPIEGNSFTMPDADVTITVTLKKLMTNEDITITIPSQDRTGIELTPVITVKDGETTLTLNEDYTVTAPSGPIQDAGNYTYTINGMGDYAGSKEATFTILPSTVIVNVTGNGTVTYNDKVATNGEVIGVVADKGTDVTLTVTPESGNAVRSVEYGYTNSSDVNMSGRKLPVSGTTATLTVPTNLKDGTGVTLTVTFAPALVGGADEASAVALTDNTVTDLAGGWYKVENDITFDHTLNLLADTYLTIAKGKTMTVNTASGEAIDSEYTLNVSGEGALNITTTEAYKIAVHVGSYVQTGATVTVNGYIGIRCDDSFGTLGFDNDFTFSGGQLTATGTSDGIRVDNTITISCTNGSDFIQSSSYDGTIKVADGKALTDGTEASNGMNGYSGTLTNEQRTAIGGKTLHRAVITSYVDATGTLHENVIAIPLDNTMTTLAAGWYVVNSDVAYTSGITTTGDVKLILGDGCTMSFGKGELLNATIIECNSHNLTIYGQSGGTGWLKAYSAQYNGIKNVYYTQYSGNVLIFDGNGACIYAREFTILGGTLDVESGGGADGEIVTTGDINIRGGKLRARCKGLKTMSGMIILDYTNATDEIYAYSYQPQNGLQIADGKTLVDDYGVIWSGALYNNQIEHDINRRTLKPLDYTGVTLTKEYYNVSATFDGTSTTTVSIPVDVNVTSVTYERTFTDGKPSTVMLPFNKAVSEIGGGTFYTFGGVEKKNNKWEATMNEVTGSLTANTPYLFVPAGTSLTFTGGATLNTTGGGNCLASDTEGWEFHGTYERKVWDEAVTHDYGFAATSGTSADNQDVEAGQFVRLTTGASAKPMRCYLSYVGGPAQARALTRGAAATDEELPSSIIVRLVGANGQTTGIGTIDTKTGEMTFDSEAWYTLDGVRLSGKPTKKGLYINNGKKIVIK